MNVAKLLFGEEIQNRPSPRLQVHQPADFKTASLPRVEWIERCGPAMHPSPLGRPGEVLAVNLAMGCAQRCAFCSARAYPRYPGDDVLHLYTGTADRVASELAARPEKPRGILISPSTDPFSPLAEVQEEAASTVEAVAGQDVEAWLMTRGYIRPSALKRLLANRDRVRVTIGLTTLDRTLKRLSESLTAPPGLRLRQIRQLHKLGVPVQVAIEPLVPGLTDVRSNLLPLLEALAETDINHVTTSYMFLRPGIRDNMLKALEPSGLAESVLRAYQGGPVLKTGPLAPAQYLPKERRQRGYAAFMALAADFGITVSVCGLTNPDFHPGPRSAPPAHVRQSVLPLF
jgi:DNA repair photolyase